MENFTRENLEYIHANYFWNYGGEGTIYKMPNGRNKTIILKLFYDVSKKEYSFPNGVMKNKQRKIEQLQLQTLPNQIQVYSPVFLEHQFIGYFMNEAISYQEFAYNTFLPYQKLCFLRKLKRQLQRFHQLGIIYGDLKSDNVLSHIHNYNQGCLCDLDNAQIGNFPIDIRDFFVDEFLHQYGEVDANLDWYALNLLTLETFYSLDRTTYIPYEETRDLVSQYRGGSLALREMQHINQHYEGNLLIEDPNFCSEVGIPYILK